MTDVKISALPNATLPLSGTEAVPIVQSGATVQAPSAEFGPPLPLTVPDGGTGLTSVAQGDMLYASAINAIARLTKDAGVTRYISNTGTSNNPAWAQVSLATGVTGALAITNGGTGQTTANTALNALLPDQTGQGGNALVTDGVDPAWTAIGAALTGTFSMDFIGFTTDPVSVDFDYILQNGIVTLVCAEGFSATSNDTQMSASASTTYPAALIPLNSSGLTVSPCLVLDADSYCSGLIQVISIEGTAIFEFDIFDASFQPPKGGFNVSSFTASGAKGLPPGWMATYPIGVVLPPGGFTGAFSIFVNTNSTGPVSGGGDGSGYYTDALNGGASCGTATPDPPQVTDGVSTLDVNICGWRGFAGGLFYVSFVGTVTQDAFTQVDLGAPANLTFTTVSATFDTATFPGYSLWSWASADEFSFLFQNLAVTIS